MAGQRVTAAVPGEKRAVKAAKRAGEVRYLVEMDFEDSRRRYVVPEAYILADEFFAFCGRLLGCAFPTGEFECYGY
jgi:hypothetical protein